VQARDAGSDTRVTATTGGLTRRLLAGVVLAVLAFAALDGIMMALLSANAVTAIAVASAGAVVVATLTLRRTIAPLVATQADLQVRYEAALADALRDPLTGLGNHRAFQEELDRQVATALRYEVPLSLMLIDLDEFKAVNDGRGHAGGDKVLRGFGQLLHLALRRADRAFRVGGDEFAVLLPHTDLAGANVVARRLLSQALQPTLRLDEFDPVSFSGGISALPELAVGPSQLYAQADAALYAAKRGGRTDVVSFDPIMEVQHDSSSSSAAVAQVIARGQLQAVYQPIVSLADGRVLGVEGLIRPVDPAPFGNPSALFAAAEATGRLTALDLACIETIVAGARRLPADQFLSLNLSPPTLEASEFSSGALLAILGRYEFPPERLVIEITERQPLYDIDRARSRLEACRRAGVRIAADDIGAGNAGLRLLAEIRFDILKVDLTLVQRSASEGQSSAVIGSVVELAARTGALVVAEGIEAAAQLVQLGSLGIEAGQGFFIGRPGALDAAAGPAPGPEPAAPAPAAPDPVAPHTMADWRQSMGLTSAR
jgi:diguanylate cyclase (GGDEF)-like protein